MPFPLILVALGVAAVAGTGAGIAGAVNLSEANDIGNKAEALLKEWQKLLEAQRQRTNRDAQSYGELLLHVQTNTIQTFIQFLEAIKNKAQRDEYLRLLDSIDITPPQIDKFKIEVIRAEEVLGTVLQAGGAGFAASTGTLGLVGLLGTASTGTSIATLSGAAAKSATLAWLGGGSLASGGAGIAGGTLVLGGLAVAPALLIGGFWLASKGSQALTQAQQYRAKVHRAVADMDKLIHTSLVPLQTRIHELKSLITELDQQAQSALSVLNHRTFSANSSRCIQQFQTAGLLIKALAEIARTPVLDNQGQITLASQNVYLKYKNLFL